MNINHLRYFLAAVEEGGITAAAQRCFVTQPTLSAGISALERMIGGVLVERDRRGVFLTPLGERLLEPAREIVHRVNGFRAIAGKISSARYLRLAVAKAVPSSLLGAVLSPTLRSGAVGECRIIETDWEAGSALLETGRADGLLTTSLVEPSGPRSVVLARVRHGLAMPKDHPLAAARKIGVSQVDGLPMIVRVHSEETRAATEILRMRGSGPVVVARVTSDALAVSLVESGVGVCLMPEDAVGGKILWHRVTGVDLVRVVTLSWRDPIWDAVFGGLGEAIRGVAVSVGGAAHSAHPDADGGGSAAVRCPGGPSSRGSARKR